MHLLLLLCIIYILYDALLISYYGRSILTIGDQYSVSFVVMSFLVLWFIILLLRGALRVNVIQIGFLLLLVELISTLVNSSAKSFVNFFVQSTYMICWLAVFTISYELTDKHHFNKFQVRGFIVAILFMVVCWSIYTDNSLNVIAVKGAYNLVYFSLFFFPFILLEKNTLLKITAIIGVFVTTVVSYKRAAIIVYVVVISYYYLSTFGKEKNAWKKIVSFVFILGIAFVGILLFSNIQSYFNLDWNTRLLSIIEDQGSGRIAIWRNVLSALKSQNIFHWIIGHGYATTTTYGGAHNDLLEMLYDFGLLGFGLYLSFIIQLFKYSCRMKKRSYEYRTVYVCSILMFLLYSFVGQLFFLPQFFLALVLFWGLILADFNKDDSQQNVNIEKQR